MAVNYVGRSSDDPAPGSSDCAEEEQIHLEHRFKGGHTCGDVAVRRYGTALALSSFENSSVSYPAYVLFVATQGRVL